mgnify:CR=1 FL=1
MQLWINEVEEAMNTDPIILVANMIAEAMAKVWYARKKEHLPQHWKEIILNHEDVIRDPARIGKAAAGVAVRAIKYLRRGQGFVCLPLRPMDFGEIQGQVKHGEVCVRWTLRREHKLTKASFAWMIQ